MSHRLLSYNLGNLVRDSTNSKCKGRSYAKYPKLLIKVKCKPKAILSKVYGKPKSILSARAEAMQNM